MLWYCRVRAQRYILWKTRVVKQENLLLLFFEVIREIACKNTSVFKRHAKCTT